MLPFAAQFDGKSLGRFATLADAQAALNAAERASRAPEWVTRETAADVAHRAEVAKLRAHQARMKAVKAAVDRGMRLIDAMNLYGRP